MALKITQQQTLTDRPLLFSLYCFPNMHMDKATFGCYDFGFVCLSGFRLILSFLLDHICTLAAIFSSLELCRVRVTGERRVQESNRRPVCFMATIEIGCVPFFYKRRSVAVGPLASPVWLDRAAVLPKGFTSPHLIVIKYLVDNE